MVEALAPRVMHFWNGLLSGFTHQEVDTLINLLTRLVVAAEGKPRGNAKLLMSGTPIVPQAKSKARKAS